MTRSINSNNRHRVLIFDSGVGGLSISKEIKTRIASLSITYIADNRTYPYGILSEQALIERIENLFPQLIERFQPETIVIACNSASTLVLDHLRQLTPIPVIGVVPAIKPAAEQTQTQTIGLLATPGTVQRAYTSRLIEDFAPHCSVIRIGSRELVDLAETKLRGKPVDRQILEQVLTPFTTNKAVDKVVLGCTHFPFLRNEISSILGNRIALIDSGTAIARRTEFILNSVSSCTPLTASPPDCFIFTKEDHTAHELAPHLQQHGFDEVEFINQ
ncbi:MAG: glutamate racemase [Pseudomonadales bacterium]|nr:glutamate racemase [Pseudomonadales bacterium]